MTLFECLISLGFTATCLAGAAAFVHIGGPLGLGIGLACVAFVPFALMFLGVVLSLVDALAAKREARALDQALAGWFGPQPSTKDQGTSESRVG